MGTNSPSIASPFLMLFRNAGEPTHRHLTSDQRLQLTKKWNDWYEELSATGKVKHGAPLELDGRVISGVRGEKIVDGPYAETKEVVGGYLFLTVKDLDEATEIGRHCPGLSIGLTVEVRPIAEISPVLRGVRGHSPQQ